MEIERECGTIIDNAVDFGKLNPVVWLFKIHGLQSLNAEEAANILPLLHDDGKLGTTNFVKREHIRKCVKLSMDLSTRSSCRVYVGKARKMGVQEE